MSSRVERVVRKTVVRGPDHRIAEVLEEHVVFDPPAPPVDDDPVLYLTEDEVAEPAEPLDPWDAYRDPASRPAEE